MEEFFQRIATLINNNNTTEPETQEEFNKELNITPQIKETNSHESTVGQEKINPILFATHNFRQPIIKTMFNNEPRQILFDTGADYNLISSKLISEQLEISSIKYMQLACTESEARVLGATKKQITLGKKNYEVQFQVIENLEADFILGTIFMEQEEVIIDYVRKCIYLGIADRQTIYWKFNHDVQNVNCELPKLPTENVQELTKVLKEFEDLFELSEYYQPTTRTTKHKIELKPDKKNKIINRRCYPLNPYKKRILYEQIDEMLAKGVIEPSDTPYSFPSVLVTYPDKAPRYCIDFRELNEISVDECANLPRITDALKDLSTAQYFSTIDLAKGYWQIQMEDTSKKYTGFSTPDGATYHFNVMPFGLKGAPATFQRLMTTEVLVGYIQQFVLVYLDDIIIYSNTLEEHIDHLRKVFERLRIHNLRVSGRKCQLMQTELEYLGHKISNQQVEALDRHKIQLKDFKEPVCKKTYSHF